MNYYEILPLTITGAENQAFTYESAGKLIIGSLVSIPLRNRFVRGMVIAEVRKPSFKTKEIKKILSADSVLNNVQLELAKHISAYYLAPLGDTISCILSFDFGKKRRKVVREKRSEISKKEKPLIFTPDQQKAFDNIQTSKPKTKHLLFGVTGSGKTEIYLQLVADALKKGLGSIILVPEISLTPQTLERFQKRFGDKVAVWHSHLKETEKFATWESIKSGEKMIVLGARSAIFAPIKNLGYIFIDEEHESSYKQDQTPRYETGRVAEWLAEISGAKLVAGSATPKIETFFKSQNNLYELHQLNTRIVQDEMPPVKIVDLADEFKKGNKSIFSDDLYEAAHQALEGKKQVLLFVNRRGASTFVVCRDCGHVLECPNCDIPLTYHPFSQKGLNPQEGSTLGKQTLECHHCGYSRNVPSVCPNCQSHAIRYFGLGTQRVEQEAKKMFPKARIARMDRDTTKKRGSHEEIYQSFAKKDYDILIGTQLIAKGWDLPNVSVVGVISADTMLNLPDFRSGERTFSLLTQVAGRTGRGYHPGRVIIQTYSPENYAIKAAAQHNYNEFYLREIKERKKYKYPPFSQIIKLTYSAKNEELTEKNSQDMKEILNKIENENVQILGPNPSFIPKLAGKFRQQIVIKILNKQSEKTVREFLEKNYKSGWTIDVNPENLL